MGATPGGLTPAVDQDAGRLHPAPFAPYTEPHPTRGRPAMPINFTCACGEPLEVDDALAGRQARCPYCEAVVSVPAADAAPPPPPPKRARLVEPEESYDDRGGTAASLNPFDHSNRPSPRRRDADADDDRPSKRRRRDEGDEGEDDRPSRRPRRAYDADDPDEDYRPRRPARDDPPPYKLFNKQVIGGLISIVVGLVVTSLLLVYADRIGCWFVILIIAGLISLIRGLATGRDS